jgi:DNA invertase Pin-like site-specific DNA recombinase
MSSAHSTGGNPVPEAQEGHLLGYARVSTIDQHPELQQDALDRAGCYRVWTDHGFSGKLASRPALDQVLDQLRPGDTLVVWRLDRLGRSLKHLIDTVNDLKERGIGFRSITEGIDTTTPAGRLVFHIFGALAEFERDLLRERTQAGLAAARARGRKGGRPRVMSADQVAVAQQMVATTGFSLEVIAKTVGVSRRTLSRYVSEEAGVAGENSMNGEQA